MSDQLATTAASPPELTFANAITMLGYIASVWWFAGGPAWAAVLGLIADELDGRVARSMGQATPFGSLLDWGVDLTLTGLAAQRAKMLWLLPAVTAAQVAMRDLEVRPPIGSARALFTLIALLLESERRATRSS